MITDIKHRISEGVVSVDDFNQLIETTYKSAQERLRRLGEPIDHNREHDNAGHSTTNPFPSPAARLAHRPGGGTRNDPRRTGRGHAMLKRQRQKNQLATEAADLRIDEIAQQWYRQNGSPRTRILLINQVGQIAKKYSVNLREAADLLQAVHDRLGIDLVGGKSVREACADWVKERRIAPAGMTTTDLETLQPDAAVSEQTITEQVVLPEATFQTIVNYNPICPHCGEVMYEKHFVPNLSVNGTLREGYLHRGPCYNKGPFLINWPNEKGGLDEAEQFVLAYCGKTVTESALSGVRDKITLQRLLSRLMTIDPSRRDWAYSVYRPLMEADLRVTGTMLGKLGASLQEIGKYGKEEARALANFFRHPSAQDWDSNGKRIIAGLVTKLKDKMANPRELAQLAELAGLPGAIVVASLFDIPDALARRSILRKWDIPDAKTKALKRLLGPRGFTAILNLFVKYPAVKNQMTKLLLSTMDKSVEGSEELSGGAVVRKQF